MISRIPDQADRKPHSSGSTEYRKKYFDPFLESEPFDPRRSFDSARSSFRASYRWESGDRAEGRSLTLPLESIEKQAAFRANCHRLHVQPFCRCLKRVHCKPNRHQRLDSRIQKCSNPLAGLPLVHKIVFVSFLDSPNHPNRGNLNVASIARTRASSGYPPAPIPS